METTEKIVEAYVRYVKGWATIPNIRCDGQHEIDLIAIDPLGLERYHIETSVSVSQSFSRLTTRAFDPELVKQRVSMAAQRRTLGFFIERKFEVAAVKEALARYGFAPGGYRNVIVTWDWTPEAEATAAGAGILLWSFQDIMREIAASIRHRRSYFGDDTLRTINLFVLALAAAEAKEDKPKALQNGAAPAASAPSPDAPFWVYRNWIHRRARLHRASCGYCNAGAGTQGTQGTATGEWKPFASRADGEAWLNGLGYADVRVCGMCG